MSWLTVLGSILGMIYSLIKLFIKSPEEKEAANLNKQKDHQNQVDDAMEKAKNEKDPRDLSRLINR